MVDLKYKQSPAKNRERCRKWHHRNKKLVLDHYSNGSARCSCCGETELVFLTLDHTDGLGAKHRKEIFGAGTGGAAIYRWVIKNGFPDLFRVLCFNCNFAFHTLGSCPHHAH